MDYHEKPRIKLSKILLIVCIVLLLVSVIAGGAYSKYRKNVVMTGNLSVGNRLVEQFKLVEHKKTLTNGTYELTNETTVSDSILYIPGAVIPVDPYLSIIGKTEIPALLYVEVIDNNPADVLKYELTDDWTLLNGVKGYHDGAVFVYRNGQVIVDFSDSNVLNEIPILRNGEITLGEEPVSEADALQFCGYLIQTDGNQTPSELFAEKLSR